VILSNPLTILWIAIPLFIQTNIIFWLAYGLAKLLRLSYEDAAPSAMIGASNHFEVAIATSVMIFGLSSGAALATVVGVLIEVPTMLMLVGICKRTRRWFGIEDRAYVASLGKEEAEAMTVRTDGSMGKRRGNGN
jgi:ACR3 family arsenite transporter